LVGQPSAESDPRKEKGLNIGGPRWWIETFEIGDRAIQCLDKPPISYEQLAKITEGGGNAYFKKLFSFHYRERICYDRTTNCTDWDWKTKKVNITCVTHEPLAKNCPGYNWNDIPDLRSGTFVLDSTGTFIKTSWSNKIAAANLPSGLQSRLNGNNLFNNNPNNFGCKTNGCTVALYLDWLKNWNVVDVNAYVGKITDNCVVMGAPYSSKSNDNKIWTEYSILFYAEW